MNDAATKCARTACDNVQAICRHTQTGKMYCVSCARHINFWNLQYPPLVTIPRRPVRPDPNQVPPSLPVLASADPASNDSRKRLGDYQRRIQVATFRISERVGQDERHLLDAYIRHCDPSRAKNGESELPAKLHRWPADGDRSAWMIYPGILFFHVGNAIVTFYDLVLGRPVLDDLERRVRLLERIAEKGPKQFRVTGTDAIGFALMHRDEVPVPFSDKLVSGEGAD